MNETINQRKHGKKRIMVQLWRKLDDSITRNFRALHLKRDAYLNDLLSLEIERLDQEVTFRNSDDVRKRIRDRPLPDRIKRNLDLDIELIDRMETVLAEKNISRDSFINRVLFFLLAKDAHLDYLGIEYEKESPATAKPLQDAKGFLLNPFFHIRSKNDESFYTLACFPDSPFGKNGPILFALNTAISDADWILMTTDLDDLLGDLGLSVALENTNATN